MVLSKRFTVVDDESSFVMIMNENIGFDGYIGTCILRIYRRYIDIYKLFKI